jgi:hypothetical protein
VLAVAAFFTVLFLLNRQKANTADYTPEQVARTILSEMKYNDLVRVEDGQVARHYDIPEGVAVSCSVYLSSSSESARELSCFLLTDTAKYDELQTAIQNHISSRAAGFQSLNPTQYQLLKNCRIVRCGRYVLVAVDSSAAEEAKLFQEMVG